MKNKNIINKIYKSSKNFAGFSLNYFDYIHNVFKILIKNQLIKLKMILINCD